MNKIVDRLALQILIEAIGFEDIPKADIEAARKELFGGDIATDRRRSALASISVTGGIPAINRYNKIIDAKKLKEPDKINLIYKIICLYYLAFNNVAYEEYKNALADNHYEQRDLQRVIKSIAGLDKLANNPLDYVIAYGNVLRGYIDLKDKGNILDFYITGNNVFADLSRNNSSKFDSLNDPFLRAHESRMRSSKPPQTVRKDFIENIVTGPGGDVVEAPGEYKQVAKLFTAIEFLQQRCELEEKLTPKFTPATKETIKQLGMLNKQKTFTTRLIQMLYEKTKLFIKDIFPYAETFVQWVRERIALNYTVKQIKEEYYGPQIKEVVDNKRYFESKISVLIDEFAQNASAIVPELKVFIDTNTDAVSEKIADYYSSNSDQYILGFALNDAPEKLGKYPTAEGIMEQVLRAIIIDSIRSKKISFHFEGHCKERKLIENLIQNEINIISSSRNVKNKSLVNEIKKFKKITGLEWPFKEFKE